MKRRERRNSERNASPERLQALRRKSKDKPRESASDQGAGRAEGRDVPPPHRSRKSPWLGGG